jgi:SAM-dependent methyltransferase
LAVGPSEQQKRWCNLGQNMSRHDVVPHRAEVMSTAGGGLVQPIDPLRVEGRQGDVEGSSSALLGGARGREAVEARSSQVGALSNPGLCCPQCGAAFVSEATGKSGPFASFDLLKCCCSAYPVVAGIPILQKGSIGATQQPASEILELIRQGRSTDALVAMLLPAAPVPADLALPWMKGLPGRVGVAIRNRYARYRGVPRWRSKAVGLLESAQTGLTACEFLRSYVDELRLLPSVCDYMVYRFSTSRHLVALSFANLIDHPARPTIELGCGCGHITRALLDRSRGQAVVGIDALFWPLFVAKTWVAPEALFLCAEADRSLPFADGIFGAAFSTDAFHYFPDRAATVKEVRRIMRPGGNLFLTTVNNAAFGHPGVSYRLRPEGYKRLLSGWPNRSVADADVLARYLQQRAPKLDVNGDWGRISQELRLSFVASEDESVFRDHEAFPDWPHSRGRLSINPLYRRAGKSSASICLQRRFPSPKYESENAECKQYMPERAEISSEGLDALEEGRRTSEVEQLIRQFVVVGVPERYAPLTTAVGLEDAPPA